MLEGNLEQLLKFVQFFAKYRSKGFIYPQNNILLDGVSFEENFILSYYRESFRDFVFVRAGGSQQTFLDLYRSEIVFYDGLDPFEVVQDVKYSLYLVQGGVRLEVSLLIAAFGFLMTQL